MGAIVIQCIVLIVLYLAGVVALIHIKKDTSIANFAWGIGVMLLALYTLVARGLYLPRQVLITTLVTIWAVRMVIYLYMRYTGKDPRFVTWPHQRNMRTLMMDIAYVFGPQLITLAIMAYPILLINFSRRPLSLQWTDYLGLLVWIIGFSIEALGDYQLYAFTKNPLNQGKVMRYGLWRYTRHPNYFGEVTLWWGIFLIAVAVPYGFTAIITSLTITGLLRFVTGVPWVEKVFERNPEYQEYKKRTNIFIPWFPKP